MAGRPKDFIQPQIFRGCRVRSAFGVRRSKDTPSRGRKRSRTVSRNVSRDETAAASSAEASAPAGGPSKRVRGEADDPEEFPVTLDTPIYPPRPKRPALLPSLQSRLLQRSPSRVSKHALRSHVPLRLRARQTSTKRHAPREQNPREKCFGSCGSPHSLSSDALLSVDHDRDDHPRGSDP